MVNYDGRENGFDGKKRHSFFFFLFMKQARQYSKA